MIGFLELCGIADNKSHRFSNLPFVPSVEKDSLVYIKYQTGVEAMW